jgi:hypothetical protein
VHHTGRSFERTPRRVFERLALRQNWLLSHNPRALHFFCVIEGVRDDPMAAEKLNRFAALIRYADRIEAAASFPASISREPRREYYRSQRRTSDQAAKVDQA